MPVGRLTDILAAKYAQDALDLLNQAGPWPSGGLVPESERITMTYDEKVEAGYFLLSREANR